MRFFMFGASLKTTNSYFQKRITWLHSYLNTPLICHAFVVVVAYAQLRLNVYCKYNILFSGSIIFKTEHSLIIILLNQKPSRHQPKELVRHD